MVDPSAPSPVADSVRLALPSEAAVIAEIQRRSWSQQLPEEAAATLLAEVAHDEMTEVWHAAIVRPPEARFRVLVAIGDARVVGFAATVPSQDPDADARADGTIDEFVIDPPAQRRSHGSRLLNACVDTLRSDGFSHVSWWVAAADDVTRAFLTEAGWAADGSHREIGSEDEQVRIKQVRLHTDITED
ncbi:MAG: GNAT family N-acetyltransferase [Propionibacteriaceae bacterium]